MRLGLFIKSTSKITGLPQMKEKKEEEYEQIPSDFTQ